MQIQFLRSFPYSRLSTLNELCVFDGKERQCAVKDALITEFASYHVGHRADDGALLVELLDLVEEIITVVNECTGKYDGVGQKDARAIDDADGQVFGDFFPDAHVVDVFRLSQEALFQPTPVRVSADATFLPTLADFAVQVDDGVTNLSRHYKCLVAVFLDECPAHAGRYGDIEDPLPVLANAKITFADSRADGIVVEQDCRTEFVL